MTDSLTYAGLGNLGAGHTVAPHLVNAYYQDGHGSDGAHATEHESQLLNSVDNPGQLQTLAGQEEEQVQQEIDIVINNVVCSFSVRCHLNLKRIAMEAAHVIYRRENGMVNMKLRNPYTTASIWSSGKITCTGATSEDDAKKAARRFARLLQKLGFRCHFSGYRVVNVLGTCVFPFGIRITQFSQDHRHAASYEPELHPGVTYKIAEPKATLKIFSTGSVTVTAPCVDNVGLAIEHIYPLVLPYKMAVQSKKSSSSHNPHLHLMPSKRKGPGGRQKPRQRPIYDAVAADESEEEFGGSDTEDEDDDFDSDDSQD